MLASLRLGRSSPGTSGVAHGELMDGPEEPPNTNSSPAGRCVSLASACRQHARVPRTSTDQHAPPLGEDFFKIRIPCGGQGQNVRRFFAPPVEGADGGLPKNSNTA